MLVSSILSMGICHIILAICFYVNEELEAEVQSGSAAVTATTSERTIEDILATTARPVHMSTNMTLESGNYDHRPAVLGWLPLLTVIIYLFMGNIGYGTLIWVVTGMRT